MNVQHHSIQHNSIRHPDEFPVEFHPSNFDTVHTRTEQDLQLICRSQQAYNSGDTMDMTVPGFNQEYAVTGIIDWCKHNQDGESYELAIRFPNDEAKMRVRMLGTTLLHPTLSSTHLGTRRSRPK